jgi:hypothetical protein
MKGFFLFFVVVQMGILHVIFCCENSNQTFGRQCLPAAAPAAELAAPGAPTGTPVAPWPPDPPQPRGENATPLPALTTWAR